jgi:hypothetical protein
MIGRRSADEGDGMNRKRSGRTVAVLMLAAAALWPAGPARAVAAPRLVEVESTGGTAAAQTAQAACADDEDVYGSGYYIKNGSGRVTVNEVFVQHQLWYVQVTAQTTDEGLGTSWSVVAQAVCGPHVEGMHRELAQVGKSASRAKSARVVCATGVAYGGGFLLDGAAGNVFVNGLVLDSDHAGVTVSATVDSSVAVPAAGWGITAYAICGPPATTMAMRQTAVPDQGSIAPRDETAACASGTGSPHGAGMTTGVVTAADRGNILVDQMRLTGQTTYVRAFENNATAGTWAVWAQAICAT